MKTNIVWDASDETRARIRAFYNRGGLATRMEIRRFVLDELEQSVKELPQPKRRKVKAAAHTSTLAEQASAWADDPICSTCSTKQSEHKARKYCPVSKNVKPGSKFTPAPAAAEAM